MQTFDSFESFKILWVVLVGMSMFSMPAFITLLREGFVQLAACTLVVSILANVFAGVYAGFTDWIGGMVLCCPFPFIALLSLYILTTKWRESWRIFDGDRLRNKLYLLGGLLIAVTQLSPSVGSWAVPEVCNTVGQNQGNSIIVALENYKRDHGGYPSVLEELAPNYLPAVPSPMCGGTFSLVHCPMSEFTLLTFGSTNGLGTNRYSLKTGNWSSVDNLDSQVCDFLE
jgi:hypothetical protein